MSAKGFKIANLFSIIIIMLCIIIFNSALDVIINMCFRLAILEYGAEGFPAKRSFFGCCIMLIQFPILINTMLAFGFAAWIVSLMAPRRRRILSRLINSTVVLLCAIKFYLFAYIFVLAFSGPIRALPLGWEWPRI